MAGEPEQVQSHHKQEEVCYNRPNYREARWERAVKVSVIS